MAKCKRNIIISLFDLTGSWSMPYRQAGYIVAQIDIFFGIDILIWNYKAIQQNKVHGIIAAPPCTHFTKVSSRFWKDYDSNGKTNYSLSLKRMRYSMFCYGDGNIL